MGLSGVKYPTGGPRYLVGVGPLDPDLVGRYAAEVLAAAEVVVAEPGVALSMRELLDPAVEVMDPADAPDAATWPAGRAVARLYPGDGVAASAADRAALARAGQPFELVPGATAAVAEQARAVLRGPTAPPAPLAGITVALTRPAAQLGGLARPLRRVGARALAAPTIAVESPDDGGAALRDALAGIERYDWLMVTSANGAHAVLAGLSDLRRCARLSVAAIGTATAAVLAGARLPADLVPERFVAEALLAAFPVPPRPGAAVLLARAAVARDVLPDGLAAQGWRVDVVAAYRTVAARRDPAVAAALAATDVVTFTSPSTVERFLELYGRAAVPPAVACIGPITAAAARHAGLPVHVEAASSTADGLVDALVAWAGTGAGPRRSIGP